MKTQLSRRDFVSSLASVGVAAPSSPVLGAARPRSEAELRVGACQILTFPEPRRSAAKVCDWLERASKEALDVVAFPEASLCGYTCEPEYWRNANPEDFQHAEATILSAAGKLRIAVILGTAHWRVALCSTVCWSLIGTVRYGDVTPKFIFRSPGQHLESACLSGRSLE